MRKGVPWCDRETKELLELYAKCTLGEISDHLNQLYHFGKPVRTPARVHDKLNHLRKRNLLEDGRSRGWTDEELIFLASCYRSPKGYTYVEIAAQLNETFHKGGSIRTHKSINYGLDLLFSRSVDPLLYQVGPEEKGTL